MMLTPCGHRKYDSQTIYIIVCDDHMTHLFSLLFQTSLFRILLSSSTLKNSVLIFVRIWGVCRRCKHSFLINISFSYTPLAGLCRRSRKQKKKKHISSALASVLFTLTFAAFSRISLSCSSFLCFSIFSSCSKKRSWERTSDVCSYLSSSWEWRRKQELKKKKKPKRGNRQT